MSVHVSFKRKKKKTESIKMENALYSILSREALGYNYHKRNIYTLSYMLFNPHQLRSIASY